MVGASVTLYTLLIEVLGPCLVAGLFILLQIDRQSIFQQFSRKLRLDLLKPRYIVFSAFISAFFVCAAQSAIFGIPKPAIHDEFAYILSADTFAHGRLTNPPHPMAPSFETMHVLQHPTYSAKYPPGQGLVLALGQVLSGTAIAGVWLSCGFAAAAIAWCMLSFFTKKEALLSIPISICSIVMNYWGLSYWGGALAAGAGALFLGGIHRILSQSGACSKTPAIATGCGAGLLALTRPFEGLVFLLFSAIVLASSASFSSAISTIRTLNFKIMVYITLPAFFALAFLGLHNYSVTGHIWLFPHALYSRQYMPLPQFIWQGFAEEPVYPNTEIRNFFMVTMKNIQLYMNTMSYSTLLWKKIKTSLDVFFNPNAFIAFLMAACIRIRKNQAMRFFAISLGAIFIMMIENGFGFSHYFAPFYVVFIGFLIAGAKSMSQYVLADRPIGQFFAVALTLSAVTATPMRLPQIASATTPQWTEIRSDIEQRALEGNTKSLFLVRYAPDHSPHQEWVYNSANIDEQGVVWARNLDDTQNERLIRYFGDRKVWLLDVSSTGANLQPYPPLRASHGK